MLRHRIAFSRLKGITPQAAHAILDRIGSEERFFALPERELLNIFPTLPAAMADDAYRADLLRQAEAEERLMTEKRIDEVWLRDTDYPTRLAQCDDAPLLLNTIGTTDLNAKRIVSIVGTRHATPYGTGFVERLVADLADTLGHDTLIVSGLAYGIDIAAHRAALKAGLPTVGVLAHGLHMLYPAQHRTVAADMVHNGGMLLTEYAFNERPHRSHFLARNRIVAGMADCTVIAESAYKGGALSTAALAMAYNRDVMALPGRISDPYSQGCNKLIASNRAILITSADDLIRAMGWTPAPKPAAATEPHPTLPLLSDDEQRIITYLHTVGEADVNRIGADLDIPMNRLMGLLISLEFIGHIATYPGAKYRAL